MPPNARPTGLNAARAAYGPLCPKPDDLSRTSRGLTACSSAGPRFHRSSVPGRKFSTITSLTRPSSRTTSRPRGERTSSVTLRLFRFVTGNPTPRLPGPSIGDAPVAGSSTMITSAPKSPSSVAAAGPASHCDRSSTRTPARAPPPRALAALACGLGRPDRLTEAGERLIAGARERDEATVARRIDIRGDDRRRFRAHPRGHRPRLVVTDDDVLLHAERRLVEADVDDLAVAAASGVQDSHQDSAGAQDRRPRLGQRHRHGERPAVGESRRELHPGERLGDAVVAALAGQRARLTER